MVILDSGASTAVAGTSWMKSWNISFEKEMKASTRTFRLGPGNHVKSLAQVAIFANIDIRRNDQSIGWIQCAIDVGVIPRGIPFLAPRSSLCQMNDMVDFGEDMLIFEDRGFPKLTTNGENHYMAKLPPPEKASIVSIRNVWNSSATEKWKKKPSMGLGR